MAKTKQCFVIMPFDEGLKDIYDLGIKPAVEMEGYECIRADEIQGAGNIIRDIITCTNEADVVIADITGKNANVMYELGLAHGLRKHVILLAQDIDATPFDLKNYRIVKYDMRIGGDDRVKKALLGALSALNDKNKSLTNPIHDFLHPGINQQEYEELRNENKRLTDINLKIQSKYDTVIDVLKTYNGNINIDPILDQIVKQPFNKPLTVDLQSPEGKRKLTFTRVPDSQKIKVNYPRDHS